MTEPDQPDRSESGRRRPTLTVEAWGLVLVCLTFVVLQWTLFPHDRPPGWDESVYLSQVTPGAEAAFFAGWRARGITLIVAPAIWAGASIGDLRVFLMVVSAVGLGLALAVWKPVIGIAASVAFFLFSCTWITLLNASQVMPNFWTAVLGLVAAGSTVRWNDGGRERHAVLDGGRERHAVLAGAALAFTALVRPTEATVIFAVLAAVVLFGRRSWTALAALSAGLVIGWLPWVVEMSVRFGGPLEALRGAASGHVAPAPVTENLLRHLSYTDGELISVVVPLPGVIWWVMLAVLAVTGIVRAATRGERVAALVGAVAALAVTIEYVVFVPVLAPRFLLPAYAFAAIPASIGLVSLFRGRGILRAAGVVVVLIAIPWAVWQAGVARRVEAEATRVGRLFREAGEQIGRLAAGDSCSFMSPAGYPQIQLASGCVGRELPRTEGPTLQELEQLGTGRESVFVILPRPASPTSPLDGVRPIRSRGPNRVWLIYRLSAASLQGPGSAA
ncbi:MAG: hypothetical protein ACRDGO_08505 [Actinomycetota bacterium]